MTYGMEFKGGFGFASLEALRRATDPSWVQDVVKDSIVGLKDLHVEGANLSVDFGGSAPASMWFGTQSFLCRIAQAAVSGSVEARFHAGETVEVQCIAPGGTVTSVRTNAPAPPVRRARPPPQSREDAQAWVDVLENHKDVSAPTLAAALDRGPVASGFADLALRAGEALADMAGSDRVLDIPGSQRPLGTRAVVMYSALISHAADEELPTSMAPGTVRLVQGILAWNVHALGQVLTSVEQHQPQVLETVVQHVWAAVEDMQRATADRLHCWRCLWALKGRAVRAHLATSTVSLLKDGSLEPAFRQDLTKHFDALMVPLTDLGLSKRLAASLRLAGVLDVATLTMMRPADVTAVPGCGPKALRQIQGHLARLGLRLRDDVSSAAPLEAPRIRKGLCEWGWIRGHGAAREELLNAVRKGLRGRPSARGAGYEHFFLDARALHTGYPDMVLEHGADGDLAVRAWFPMGKPGRTLLRALRRALKNLPGVTLEEAGD